MTWDGRHLLDVEGLGTEEIGRVLALATEFRADENRGSFADGTHGAAADTTTPSNGA